MQPQTVSVMKKCGTGGSPVDAYSFTFANKLTNTWRGSRSYAAATADDRLVFYAQSSSTPSLQYCVAYTDDTHGNRLTQSCSPPSTHPSISYGYDAFGNMYDVSTNSVYFPRYTFSTKEYLSDAKLYIYVYRVYDPVAGRWTQRDPIDYQDSLNLYQFCGNNPVNKIDPYGLKDKEPSPDEPPPTVKEKGSSTDYKDSNSYKSDREQAYNCFSHALFNGQGHSHPNDRKDQPPRWASPDSAEKKLNESYQKLDPNANNKKGDIVVYRDKDGNLVHAGIVTQVDKDGNTTRVESKFGPGPLVSHHPRQTIDPTTGKAEYQDTTREYYRAK